MTGGDLLILVFVLGFGALCFVGGFSWRMVRERAHGAVMTGARTERRRKARAG